ncbi:GAF domain-containing protein [Sphingomonas sp.]|uniref:GAF domain-containing protein n=1 Tax=Sphingomonas sp. TaxID=28214 RepID=UPI002BEDA48F|nr:GAF domain-containing protein [Sphingomonas sp.]HWK35249.1 GAF domain-containing protein [Sphingomonas sp.]
MLDESAQKVVNDGDNDEIRAILREICDLTGMGFAAVARVTDRRWIAAQVLDKIEFGLNPGDELELKTTICDEIRQSGVAVIVDQISIDEDWRTHPTPMLYGFESYASIPIFLTGGQFYGTLCAIDPGARTLNTAALVAKLHDFAARVAVILSRRPGD